MLLVLPLLLAPALLPRVDAQAEAAHELGVDPLRGTLWVGVEAIVLDADSWHLDLFTGVRTFVRSNRSHEGPIRISPQQIWFPVGARWMWRNAPGPAGAEWGVFARHQSNHDVDETDPVLNIETIAYEVYGVEWAIPALRVGLGLYYDRGTTRELRRQTLPFDHYLAGLSAAGRTGLWGPLYGAAALEAVAHRDPEHSPAYVNLSGRADLGAALAGAAGAWRVFLRFERVEDYRFLGEPAHHLLLLGTGFDTRAGP